MWPVKSCSRVVLWCAPSFYPSSCFPSLLLSFLLLSPRSLASSPVRCALLHSGSRSLLFRLHHLSLAVLCVVVRYVAFCCVAAFDFIAFSVLARALANERRHGSHYSIAACTPAPGHAPSPLLPMILLKKPSRHDRRRCVIATLLGFAPPDEQLILGDTSSLASKEHLFRLRLKQAFVY